MKLLPRENHCQPSLHVVLTIVFLGGVIFNCCPPKQVLFIWCLFTGGQMIVTDLGEEGQRADALGKLGLSYGVGMVIGPFLGGLVTKFFR